MTVIAHEPAGFEGSLVYVEVDIRRGIPGVDLVGLAAGRGQGGAGEGQGGDSQLGLRISPRSRPHQSRPRRSAQGRGGLRPAHGPRPPRGRGRHARAGTPGPRPRGAPPGRDGAAGPRRAARGGGRASSAGVDRFIVPEENAAEARALRKGLVFPIQAPRRSDRALRPHPPRPRAAAIA